MSKPKRTPQGKKASKIDLSELKREDFAPISKRQFGESLRKSIAVQKPKN